MNGHDRSGRWTLLAAGLAVAVLLASAGPARAESPGALLRWSRS